MTWVSRFARAEKTNNGGQWTDARFHAFIVSALRSAHGRWGPQCEAKREAKVSRGIYRCDGCGTVGPATLPPLPGRKQRRVNAAVDHINPVVDPDVGFVDWGTYISRMFCEREGYQVLCATCHEEKTAKEIEIAKARRLREADSKTESCDSGDEE